MLPENALPILTLRLCEYLFRFMMSRLNSLVSEITYDVNCAPKNVARRAYSVITPPSVRINCDNYRIVKITRAVVSFIIIHLEI
jgi:hypothetical protein